MTQRNLLIYNSLGGNPAFTQREWKLPGGEWEVTIEPQRAGPVPVPGEAKGDEKQPFPVLNPAFPVAAWLSQYRDLFHKNLKTCQSHHHDEQVSRGALDLCQTILWVKLSYNRLSD